MTVREATREDVGDIVALGLSFLAEEYAGSIVGDAGKLAAQAERMIADQGMFVLENRGGAVVGMIGLIVYDHFLAQERIVTPVCWWVEPSERGQGRALWLRGLQWGRDRGATTVMASAPNARTEQIYSKLGMQKVEVHYRGSVDDLLAA